MRCILIKAISKLHLAAISLLACSVVDATSLTWVEDVPLPMSWKVMRIPKWSHGALINVQNADNGTHPLIWVVERQKTYTLNFEIPGARSINIYDWDRTF